MLLSPNCLVTTAIRSTALFPDRPSQSVFRRVQRQSKRGGTRAALFHFPDLRNTYFLVSSAVAGT
jgi:hypothetical protein